jgi:hypothetical protein
LRDAVVQRIGEGPFRGVFSLLSIAVLVFLVSLPTLPWREMDSNHRSLSRGSRFILRKVNCAGIEADDMSDEEATLIVTSGTAMYGLLGPCQ